MIALAGCDCSVESGPATTPCAPISHSQVSPSSWALSLFITTTARRAVGDLRRRAGGDGAVLAEGRLEAAQRVGGGVGADPLVLAELQRITLALRDVDRHDFVGEDAVLPRRGGLLVRLGRVFVLLLPGELVDVVALLGQRAHRLIGEHVVQTVVGHVVQHGDVAVLVAGPAVHQQVGRLRHGLLATGHHHVELAGPNELVGQRDGVDTRTDTSC